MDLELAITSAGTASVAIECADTGDGDRILPRVNGRLLGDVTDPETRGPFDKIGMYAHAVQAPLSARFNEVVVWQPGQGWAVTTTIRTTREVSTAWFARPLR